MLINSLDNVDKVAFTALDQLDLLPIKLYLTGSRYFNNYKQFPLLITETTDYDYFCQYSDANVKCLLDALPEAEYVAASSLNMKIGHYNDKNIVGVAFIKSLKLRIDVQFVKHLDLKIEVQKILAAMGDCYFEVNKQQQKFLWDKQYERICKERNIIL